MRKIKFRAYDKYKKEMHIVSGMDWDIFKEELKIISIGYNDNSCLAYNRNHTSEKCDITALDIMQYTGLKDKNGKEIYEGDIVSFNLKSDNEGQPNITGYVEYQTTFSGYRIMSFKGSFALDYNIKDIEVIGNIYDNPELLGGSDGRD